MGGEEKAQQIGAAVTEYQEAKIACAHIDKKIDKVFSAYLRAGSTMDRNKGSVRDPQIVSGKIVFGYGGEGIESSALMNEKELLALLIERDEARKRLEDARKAMNSLGITSLS